MIRIPRRRIRPPTPLKLKKPPSRHKSVKSREAVEVLRSGLSNRIKMDPKNKASLLGLMVSLRDLVANPNIDQDSDDAPFFMSNQSKYQPNNNISSGSDDLFGIQNRDDSENDDLRGVIDDLTIENKRLKLILRSQRGRPSPTTDSQDKLFEVRMHGLPPEKKRELEMLLKNFASSVTSSTMSLSSSSVTVGSGVPNSDPSSSGNRSTLIKNPNTDSGYGSHSNSGQASIAQSNSGNNVVGMSKGSKDRAIKNYLHDIPETLLPRTAPLMTERAKMALIVQRLEQLFTGRNAVPGEHSQPLQQQEISQSAARADRFEDAQNNRVRKDEGSREAHMLPLDSKVNLDSLDRQEPSPPEKAGFLKPRQGGPDDTVTVSPTRPGSPEQRPTRPLDLDIHRAQVAAENIEYLRHLGLSSPRFDRVQEPLENSWIYLNLLISMAQLHTLNVTPNLIRKAIRKFSTKFELSKDGHRVRWTGGPEGTIFSKEDERAMEATNESPLESTEESGRSSSKRSKTNSTSNLVTSTTPSEEKTSAHQTRNTSTQQVSTSATSQVPASNPAFKTKPLSAFDYRPVVYTGLKRSHHTPSYLDSSPSYESGSGESNSLVQALSRHSLSQRQQAEEGTITFFSNSYFCSDFSGDRAPANWRPGCMADPVETLGIEYEVDVGESPLRHHDACYYTPQFARPPYKPSPGDAEISFTPAKMTSSGEYETQPIELPVSGIGGVFPQENFALDVKVMRMPVQYRRLGRVLSKTPVTGTEKRAQYMYKLQSCQHLELKPSQLPPPTYIVFTSSSSSGAADMQGSSDLSDSESSEEDEFGPGGLFKMWSTGSSVDPNFDLGAEDLSMDMLEAARAVDPVAIAAQERNFVLNQSGANPVSGSLAATVGASRSTTSIGEHVSSGAEDDGSEMEVDD